MENQTLVLVSTTFTNKIDMQRFSMFKSLFTDLPDLKAKDRPNFYFV